MVSTVVSDAMITYWIVTKYFEVHLVKTHNFSPERFIYLQGKLL